jgi:hypothetical protein
MSGQEDLFKTRIKLELGDGEAIRLQEWAIREGAISYILSEIEASKLLLSGVVFCKAIIEKFRGKCTQKRCELTYRIASRHGIKLHEVSAICTEHDGEAMFLTVSREGEAP